MLLSLDAHALAFPLLTVDSVPGDLIHAYSIEYCPSADDSHLYDSYPGNLLCKPLMERSPASCLVNISTCVPRAPQPQHAQDLPPDLHSLIPFSSSLSESVAPLSIYRQARILFIYLQSTSLICTFLFNSADASLVQATINSYLDLCSASSLISLHLLCPSPILSPRCSRKWGYVTPPRKPSNGLHGAGLGASSSTWMKRPPFAYLPTSSNTTLLVQSSAVAPASFQFLKHTAFPPSLSPFFLEDFPPHLLHMVTHSSLLVQASLPWGSLP